MLMRPHLLVVTIAGLFLLLLPAPSSGHESDNYPGLRQVIATEDAALRVAIHGSRGARRRASMGKLEAALLARVDRLHQHWLGTRWGLGMPQTRVPHTGKINCGMFVARVLRDAGFRLNVWKFNRQTAADAIRSVASKRARRYFHDAPMDKFLARIKKMGPGLFIIGLDFHIGFLRQTEDDLRFVHASYIDKKVVDEPAASAIPIVTSRYRVVGKILQADMLSAWLARRRIKVMGEQ